MSARFEPTPLTPAIVFGPLTSYTWLANSRTNVITIADNLTRDETLSAISEGMDALASPQLTVHDGGGRTTKRRSGRLHLAAVGA
jgi:hypothetical protein